MFTIVFLCCILAITAGFIVYSKVSPENGNPDNDIIDDGDNDSDNDPDGTDQDDDLDQETPLEKAFKEKNRVNFLVLGLEGSRTDTIIFASFDRDTKKVDMISIPRDTYYLRQGQEYSAAEERKINAIYGDNGTKEVEKVVSNMLYGVPIHNYVKVKYEGVEKIVDSLGGVEVDVPMDMKYEDPYDDPPLVIDIPKGRQVLNGENAVKFLRFRSGYKGGDLDRVKTQQEFIKSAAKKALSFKIVSVIRTAFHYVDTDITLTNALFYGADAAQINISEDLNMMTMPGHEEKRTYKGVKLSYFIKDDTKLKKLIMELYDVEEENTDQ
ncbi:LCP family protein [Sporosalibacterium faouarense]|uniref:LCP family glycopolymer transferase n=1 Tax=Sporosalibacterium faouarense TaxID=516123 RepID=UPI001A9CA244